MDALIVEKALRRAWVEALGGVVRRDDDFFVSGGDSLTALAVTSSLRRQLGVVLDPGFGCMTCPGSLMRWVTCRQ